MILALPGIFFIVYQVQQWQIRHAMEEKLEEDNLQTLVVAANHLVWEEEGKELIIEGTLFDVKKINPMPNGTVEVIGLFDRQETAIKKMASDLTASSSSTEKNAKLGARIVSVTLFHQSTDFPALVPPEKDLSVYQPRKTDYLVCTYLPIHCPPPEA